MDPRASGITIPAMPSARTLSLAVVPLLLHALAREVDRALGLVRGMTVNEDRMRANLDLTSGALFSQRALLALVERGMARDEAYRIVQAAAQRAWAEGTPLRELLEAEPAAQGLDLDAIFDEGHFTRHAAEIVGRLDAIV